MVVFLLQAVVVLALLALWWGRRWNRSPVASAPPPAPTPTPTPTPPPPARRLSPHHPSAAGASLEIRVVFVEDQLDRLRLDCLLVEPFAGVEAGDVFTMVVALPHGVEPALAALFERWASSDATVKVQLAVGPRGPKAAFAVDETRADLDLLASSRLRHVDGRG